MNRKKNTISEIPAVLQEKKEVKNLYVLTQEYLQKRLQFRLNCFSGMVEYKKNNDSKYKPLSDRMINQLVVASNQSGINTNKAIVSTVLNTEIISPEYNPLSEYIQSLPAWDGETDHIAELASRVVVKDNPNWHEHFKRWFVAMIASGIDSKVHNEVMLILYGPQSIGKTTFLRNLIPSSLSSLFFSGLINPANEEFLGHLSKFLLINMDELVGMNRKSFKELKEFLSKKDIYYRVKYDKFGQDFPRRASFAGTTNEQDFLFDLSGNRRFICIEIQKIDNSSPLQLDKCYAQAYALYISGYRFWFDSEDISILEKQNSRFLNVSTEEEKICELFEPCESSDKDFLLTATEIAEYIFKRSVDNNTVRRVGIVLKAKGFVRKKKKSGNQAYCLKAINIDTLLEVGNYFHHIDT
jgi:predicted P-loop ATPase